jgi:hypothetical protein
MVDQRKRQNNEKLQELFKDVEDIPMKRKQTKSQKRKKDDYIPMEETSENEESDSNKKVKKKSTPKKRYVQFKSLI